MSERIGCGDNSCVFSVLREAGGMGTNGGCRCLKRLESWNEAEQRWNRAEVQAVERDTRRLVQALREARAEVERLREALRGLKLDEWMTYEGNLEAHGYASTDALEAARAALAGKETP